MQGWRQRAASPRLAQSAYFNALDQANLPICGKAISAAVFGTEILGNAIGCWHCQRR
jgi:hypothetical protein